MTSMFLTSSKELNKSQLAKLMLGFKAQSSLDRKLLQGVLPASAPRKKKNILEQTRDHEDIT